LIESIYFTLTSASCVVKSLIDEWSQCIILSVLIRYARTQFTDPNLSAYDTDAVAEADPQPAPPTLPAASFGDLLGDDSLAPVVSNAAADSGAAAASPPLPAADDADSASPVASAAQKKKKKKPTLDSFYEDESDDGSAAFANVRSNAPARANVAAATATSVFLGGSSVSRVGVVKGSIHSVETIIDEDLRLLLKCVEPLLRSRNSAVVLAVVSLFHSLLQLVTHLGP